MNKTCSRCDLLKPISEFYKNSISKDGFGYWCKGCVRVASAASAKKNPEHQRARQKAWRDANPNRVRANQRALYRADPERQKKYQTDYYAKNPGVRAEIDARHYEKNRTELLARDREKRLANIEDYRRRERESYARTKEKRAIRMREWRQANKSKIAFYAADRRAAIIKRTPKWLDELDKQLMEAWYWYAEFVTQETGVEHHVDHIVPLRGKFVSGLNVPWNLQVIPGTDNIKKGNRHVD